MKRKQPDKGPDRELQRVVRRVLLLVPTDRAVAKADFERILHEVMAHVQKKTGASSERLRQVTDKVLADFPSEYGGLPERQRSWPVLITYLYAKFLHELREPGKGKG
jgi:hypothetical protein